MRHIICRIFQKSKNTGSGFLIQRTSTRVNEIPVFTILSLKNQIPSLQRPMKFQRTWQTKSNFTDRFCQTDLKYSIFGGEKHAKKIFGKIDF